MSTAQRFETYLDKNYPNAETSIYRDLSMNMRKAVEEGSLDPAERFMNLLAVATAIEDRELMEFARKELQELGVADDQIRESAEVAGIMGMNNVYYKFRSFVAEDAKEHYSRAGLRMMSLGKPVTGKHVFEMMSLAVSAINGCPVCVSSHEKSLRDLGVATEKIHDVIRMAASAKGLSALRTARALFA